VRSSADQGDFILPVGTVTLLLADVEGSTRQWETEPDAMREAVVRYDELVADAVGKHGGVRPLDQGEGDSFVAAFARASDALASALQLQRAIADDDSVCFGVRIALHTGEVQLRDDVNYIGTVINRTARLREIGHGGQTLVSRATHDLVTDTLPSGVTLRELGSHRLRDLARPEEVFQVCHADLPDDFAPLRSLDAYPNNLPAQLTTFIGRHDELAEISKLLHENRLLTLTGAGGCGKTRLALQCAAEASERFVDGTWFCNFGPVGDAQLVPATIASALGIHEEPNRPFVETIASRLTGRRTLLLLDNCEHLIVACADVADNLLRICPDVTVLATSREPLRVEGEVAWRVPSLSIPEPQDPVAIETLGSFDAVRLFVDGAVRVRPNFSITNDNATAIAQICQRLEGIPLAIELASAMVRMMPPEQIAAGLDDRFRVLGAGPRTALPRHQTLRASVDWSFDLLSDAECVLLRRLSVFAGGFTLEAAETVCGLEPLDAYAVLPTLSSLVDKSLVLVDEGISAARYHQLETIKQYGAERLRAAGEESAIRELYVEFFTGFVGSLEPRLTTDQQNAAAEFLTELDNIRGALDWCVSAERAEAGCALGGRLLLFWYVTGYWNEALRRYDELVSAAGDASSAAVAQALLGSGFCRIIAGDMEAATVVERSVAMARDARDLKTLGRALYVLGHVRIIYDPAAARPALEEGLALAEQTNDVMIVTDAGQAFGQVELAQGRPASARSWFNRTYELAKQLGDTVHVAESATTSSYAASLLGDYGEAERLAHEGLDAARELDNLYFESNGLGALSVCALGRGDVDRALELAEEAMGIEARTGTPSQLPSVWFRGSAYFARGDIAAALPALLAATDSTQVLMFRTWSAEVHATTAEAHLELGDPQSARAAIDEGLEAAAFTQSDYARARVLYVLARLERNGGAHERAESTLHEALRIQVEAEDRPGVCDTLEAIAGVAAEQESSAEAARLFGAAQSLRDQIGCVRWPVRRLRYDADVALLSGDVDAAWTEGAAMSIEEAVTYAARGRGERKRPSSGWASLTPTEIEVVKLAAQGLSNPQIAEKLFISRHTVKVHVSHVFAKLGIASRAELASEATRRGLL
jgi:predicted ATPase/class 3 adenylate cyclase/DNA-binding CsgD family transcriptional regulator